MRPPVYRKRGGAQSSEDSPAPCMLFTIQKTAASPDLDCRLLNLLNPRGSSAPSFAAEGFCSRPLDAPSSPLRSSVLLELDMADWYPRGMNASSMGVSAPRPVARAVETAFAMAASHSSAEADVADASEALPLGSSKVKWRSPCMPFR